MRSFSAKSLVCRQQMVSRDAWRFYAAAMSDGRLRSLAVLVAILQEGVRVVWIEETEAALHPGVVALTLTFVR